MQDSYSDSSPPALSSTLPNHSIQSLLSGIHGQHSGGVFANSTIVPGSPGFTPIIASPELMRSQGRPGRGEVKGIKAIYDPMLDKKLSAKKKKGRRVQYQDFGEEDDEVPPEDPRLRIPNYTTGAANKPKQRLRIAPYTLKPYDYDSKTSCRPRPPTRVVVTGFDPLVPVQEITQLFSSFGDIAGYSNKTDPTNGYSLGVCLIHHKDSKSVRGGPPVLAIDAAKRAHLECKAGKHRVGLNVVAAELDRDGSVRRRAIAETLEKNKPNHLSKLPLEVKDEIYAMPLTTQYCARFMTSTESSRVEFRLLTNIIFVNKR